MIMVTNRTAENCSRHGGYASAGAAANRCISGITSAVPKTELKNSGFSCWGILANHRIR
jgi:hypothetical protein